MVYKQAIVLKECLSYSFFFLKILGPSLQDLLKFSEFFPEGIPSAC